MIDGKREGNQFTAQINNLIPGKTYYIRAFAQNSAGINYGSVKRIKIKENYIAPFDGSPMGANGTVQNGLDHLCMEMQIGSSIRNLAGSTMVLWMVMEYGYGMRILNGLGQERMYGHICG